MDTAVMSMDGWWRKGVIDMDMKDKSIMPRAMKETNIPVRLGGPITDLFVVCGFPRSQRIPN